MRQHERVQREAQTLQAPSPSPEIFGSSQFCHFRSNGSGWVNGENDSEGRACVGPAAFRERDKTFRTLCLAFVRERKKSRVDAQVHAAGVALQPASDFWPCEPCLALPSVPRESNTFAPGATGATGATGAVWSIQIDAGLCAGLLPGCQSPRPGHRFPHLCKTGGTGG